jgi:hypothetical protein
MVSLKVIAVGVVFSLVLNSVMVIIIILYKFHQI